ncbi:hypothetical protein MPL1032_360028 [Mesorhizobium plurifarium]|uniref:Uncharacterized protein n=1 Tax=Mesorhizobium plurifarium TaxID=69974 RepID=A0A0K2W4B7_MESPL|nr:hypothetical protein MPL1032_360028 [Mesorhizobium plurifarium]
MVRIALRRILVISNFPLFKFRSRRSMAVFVRFGFDLMALRRDFVSKWQPSLWRRAKVAAPLASYDGSFAYKCFEGGRSRYWPDACVQCGGNDR